MDDLFFDIEGLEMQLQCYYVMDARTYTHTHTHTHIHTQVMNKMFGDRKLYSITDGLPVITDVLEAGIDKQVSHVYIELWPHVGMKRNLDVMK